MAKKTIITVSVQDEVEQTGKAVAQTMRAVFAGQPGAIPSSKTKRKSIPWKLSIRGLESVLENAALQQIIRSMSGPQAAQLETVIRKAMMTAIESVTGNRAALIKVFGRSLGIARATTNLDNEAFVRFLHTPAGAGEIGLPDIDKALKDLKIALAASITIDRVSILDKGLQIILRFNQRTLLKLTPHPNRFEGGFQGPFFSWLQLITGPQLVTGGTPGFGLVRVRDLMTQLQRSGSATNLRRVEITHSLLNRSRTRSIAGNMAAIMMSTRRSGSKRSPAEAFGGVTEDYSPSRQFDGFWDEWWLRTKNDLSRWAQRIMFTAIKAVIEKTGG